MGVIHIAVMTKYDEDRKIMCALLTKQEDFRIVSAGIDGFDALRSARTQRPHIIIMDSNLGDSLSIDLAPVIKRNSPSTALVVFYSQNEQIAVDKAIKAGISGYLIREEGFENLISSVRCVFYGGLYISNAAKSQAKRYLSTLTTGEKPVFPEDLPASQNLFSPTELCIFREIILGHTDKEIAKSLNISTGSLRNCVNRVKHKTGLHNRTQITIYALLCGIINVGKIKNLFYRQIND